MSPRDSILRRRARFVAAAIASAGVAVSCGPTPCLEPPVDAGTGDARADSDTGPTPCLDVAPDSGTDGG